MEDGAGRVWSGSAWKMGRHRPDRAGVQGQVCSRSSSAGVGRCGVLGVREGGKGAGRAKGHHACDPPQNSPAQHGLGVATEVEGFGCV